MKARKSRSDPKTERDFLLPNFKKKLDTMQNLVLTVLISNKHPDERQTVNLYSVKYCPATNTRGSGFIVRNMATGEKTFTEFDYSANSASEWSVTTVTGKQPTLVGMQNGTRFYIVN